MANISLHVNEYVNVITTYICKTQRLGDKFDPKESASFMAWGGPGIGKSAAVKTIAKNVKQELNKEVYVTDVRLLLFNPVDLRGVPVPDAERKFAKWLMPQIFNMNPDPNVINILMLDEISAAPPSVQAAAYQITLDRQVGEHKLPDNCYIICAGNRLQDKSVAYKMPKALANRLVHFDITSELEDWKVWALNNGIDSRIIGFLNQHPNKLTIFDPNSDDNAFPTPRTWEKASHFINIFGGISEAYNPIAGSIGLGVAGEFKTYCEVYTSIPNVDEILNGTITEVPEGLYKKPDVAYALSSALSYKASHTKDAKKLENALEYIFKLQHEFSIMTIKDMITVEGVKPKLLKIKKFLTWLRENGDFIA